MLVLSFMRRAEFGGPHEVQRLSKPHPRHCSADTASLATWLPLPDTYPKALKASGLRRCR
jgi:hypothetical protein